MAYQISSHSIQRFIERFEPELTESLAGRRLAQALMGSKFVRSIESWDGRGDCEIRRLDYPVEALAVIERTNLFEAVVLTVLSKNKIIQLK